MTTTVTAANGVQVLSAARRALAEADSLPDIGRLVDYAEAAKVAARRAGLSEEAQRDWAGYSLEAQRKAGQLLAAMPRQGRGRPDGNSDTLSELLDAPVAEANQKAKRWQDVAAVPDDVFNDYLANATEVTRSRLLRISRDRTAAAERERIGVEHQPAPADAVDIRTGDFRHVLHDLTDIDAVITDPPYPREFLPLLAHLAEFAERVLTPDGVLAVMFGQTHLPDVYRLLSGGRPYRWTICYATPGNAYVSQARRLHSNWKPVLVYGGGPRFNDVITASRDDKAHHSWGQDYVGIGELVTRLTHPGQHVVDPFLGGGTTALACRNLGRRFTGCDIDPDAVASTLKRLT